jgi:hypothetical protein
MKPADGAPAREKQRELQREAAAKLPRRGHGSNERPSAPAPVPGEGIDVAATLAFFDSESLEEIERALSLPTPCDELRGHLATLVGKSIQNSANAPPRSKNVRARLDRLRSTTRDFRKEIDSLASSATDEDDEALWLLRFVGGSPHPDIAQLANRLSALEDALASASRYLLASNSGGSPRGARHALVASLRGIEQAVTGRPTQFTRTEEEDGDNYTGGPLWKMLRACENATARAENRPPPSDAALASFLSRTKVDDKTD